MKKAILHISDLHISRTSSVAEKPRKPNSWLTTESDELKDHFLNDFVKKIKEKHPDTTWTLIVSGDITNEGDELEFQTALVILNKIIEDLGIDKNSLLIVPGDHDVNRYDSQKAFLENRNTNLDKKAFEYHQEKFDKFGFFYRSIISEDFTPDTAIVRLIEFPEFELLLVGINSNFKIDFEGGLGCINVPKLETELKSVSEKYSKHLKVAVFHHNIFSNYEDKKTGQWDSMNRADVISCLESYGFKLLLFGNEHTRSSDHEGSFDFSDCGSLGKKDPNPSFKVYELKSDSGRISLKQSLYLLINKNGNQDKPYGRWGIQDNEDQSELDEFVLKQPPVEIYEKSLFPDEISDLNLTSSDKENTDNLDSDTQNDKELLDIVYKDDFYQNFIFTKVKEKGLYHSGHFHWSSTSRAHNWIDVAKLLQDKDDLLTCKLAMLDVIEKCQLGNQFDFIIGLGIEGNILATRIAFKFSIPYSYLPYSYRYSDHNEFEKDLNFLNNGEFKTVLLITDVVHDGRTIRKLLNQNEKAFFEKVEKIIVLSLFYTGSEQKNLSTILNRKAIEDELIIKGLDFQEKRIEFYFIKKMKVEECPYGPNSNIKEDCLLVKEAMGCIHKFYNYEDEQ